MNPMSPANPMSPLNPSTGMFNPASPYYYITGPGAYQQHSTSQVANTQPSNVDGSDVMFIIFAFILLAAIVGAVMWVLTR